MSSGGRSTDSEQTAPDASISLPDSCVVISVSNPQKSEKRTEGISLCIFAVAAAALLAPSMAAKAVLIVCCVAAAVAAADVGRRKSVL